MSATLDRIRPAVASEPGTGRCFACGAAGARPFYEALNIPVHSCRMMASREAALAFPRRDLRLTFCPSCGFIQNEIVDAAMHEYGEDYVDSQTHSPHFRAYLEGLADEQIRKHRLHGKTVLEIGCGSGDFLMEFSTRGGCTGIGIDPRATGIRRNPSQTAQIDLIADHFGPAYLDLPADYVCCRHTLEHVYDPRGFVRMLRRLLTRRRRVTAFFEVPDASRILAEGAFWDVYYEHCGYFTPGSLARLFRAADFELVALERTYGDQYLILEAVAPGGGHGRTWSEEDDLQRTAEAVETFRAGVTLGLSEMAVRLRGWAEAGRRVVLWGASSKAVAYLAALGGGASIAAVVDVNPQKRGRFLAGTGHEILHPDDLVELRPDVAVLTNPVYTDEIRRTLAERDLHPELVPL